MDVIYSLWHVDPQSSHLVNTYDSEAVALAVVCNALRAYGPAYVDALILTVEDNRGRRGRIIAKGAALAEHASASDSNLKRATA